MISFQFYFDNRTRDPSIELPMYMIHRKLELEIFSAIIPEKLIILLLIIRRMKEKGKNCYRIFNQSESRKKKKNLE